MIYIFSLLLCLLPVCIYDVLGRTENKQHWYYLLMSWFIILSGFQYMVGSDIPGYMETHATDYDSLNFGAEDVGGRHQPGWILLSFFCRQITDDFFLLKLIQAIFVNVAIFTFFKRESKYVFTCIFLYAITSYLIFNFNILRQSFAIGFLLYYISALRREKYVLAAFFFFMSFMFHNSALIGLIIPLFKFIKYNRWTFISIGVIGVSLIVFLIKMDFDAVIMSLLDSDMLGDNLTEHTEMYTNSDKFGVQDVGVGIGRYGQISIVLVPLFYYVWKKKDMFFGGLCFMYLFIQVLNFSLPIMFRFRYFFDPVFYIVFSWAVLEWTTERFVQVRYLIISLCFAFYSAFPYIEYTATYEGSSYRYIDQYYPYYSIFDTDDVDQQRINYMNSL